MAYKNRLQEIERNMRSASKGAPTQATGGWTKKASARPNETARYKSEISKMLGASKANTSKTAKAGIWKGPYTGGPAKPSKIGTNKVNESAAIDKLRGAYKAARNKKEY